MLAFVVWLLFWLLFYAVGLRERFGIDKEWASLKNRITNFLKLKITFQSLSVVVRRTNLKDVCVVARANTTQQSNESHALEDVGLLPPINISSITIVLVLKKSYLDS